MNETCSSKVKVSKKRMLKRPWSKEERDAVEKHLLTYILRGKIPGADEIRKCLREENVLNGRNWKNVKDFCRNKIISINRNKK